MRILGLTRLLGLTDCLYFKLNDCCVHLLSLGNEFKMINIHMSYVLFRVSIEQISTVERLSK